jgi:uncharacterized membrane protein
MLATFATLILLVQHISTMLQAPNIAAAAGVELQNVVSAEISNQVTSDDKGHGRPDTRPDSPDAPIALAEIDGYPIRARSTGYIQFVDPDTLLTLAREKDLIIRLLRRPGHYIWSGAVVALVSPADRVDEQLDKLIRRAFQVGNGRTPTQDIEYAVNQLTEMAVRAMSPAINDPFTAMTCLDHVGYGLMEFIRQGRKGSHYYDRDGKLRLVLEPVTLEVLLDAAFDMLRHASCDNASVLLHMLKVIDLIGQEVKTPEARQQLLRHVSLIQAESQAGALIEQDRQSIYRSGEALQMKLAG